MELSKCDLFPVSRGVDFLGYRHFKNYILLRKSTAKRVRKRLPKILIKWRNSEITKEQFRSSVSSTIGWLKWANTFRLKNALNIDNMLQLLQTAS